MKKYIYLILLWLITAGSGFAQMVQQNESFESATAGAPAIFPSPGWRLIRYPTAVSATFQAQAVATTTNPACAASPGGGFNVMTFTSYTGANNDSSLIVTKPFDFSNNGGVNPQFSFYMYRDNGFLANDDHIRVYINTSPTLTGATLLSNTIGTNQIFRRNSGIPAATANTWNQYTYDLPAASYTQKRYYFMILGVCRDGNNIYIDQVRTNTYPSATNASDVSFDLFTQNPGALGQGGRNQMIVGIRCIIAGTSGNGVVNGALSTALKLDSLLLNTNGTTNLTDMDDAKIFYTGGSVVFDTNYVSPYPATAGSDDYPARKFGQIIAVPGTNLDFVNSATSCSYLEYDTTYFWLAVDIKNTATSGNSIDAELRSAAVGGTAGTCPSPGGTATSVVPSAGGFSIPGAPMIDLAYCIGTYYTGTSGLWNSYQNNDYIQSVILNGAAPTVINTNTGASNNNQGIPATVPCYPNCDFTAHPPDYELWAPISGRTASLTQGVGYSITVQAGTWPTANNIAVFIDYNRDGDFTDAGEKLGQVNLTANQSQAIAFAVPATGYAGITRMRVREAWAVSNIDPCAQYGNGETEDFYVTILPSCPAGYKLWLGNTDDWNDASNWCGGVPTFSDDAVVDAAIVFPPSGVRTRNYFKPTVKSTTTANCNNLTVSSMDTLLINAPSATSTALKVRKDLTNNGRIQVISAYSSSSTFGNGTIANAIYTPFKSQSTDARTQIIYSAAELLQSGMISGDRISGLQFTIATKNSTNAFSGFTVSYALVPFNQHSSNVPYSGAMTTVYGPLAFTTVLGTNGIALTTPIIWDGTSNLLIQYCFNNAANTGPADDRINITQTTGLKSTLILSSTTNASPGCALQPGAGVTDNFFTGLNSYRPNFTFVFDRTYAKALLTVQEDWINNGTFVPGYSRVLLDSTRTQTIAGNSVTIFNELEVSKGTAAQTVTLQKDMIIDSSLILTQGALLMNSKYIMMNNGAPSTGTLLAPTGPFTRTNGFLISENAASVVIWKNVNNFGYRVVPFGSEAIATPVYVPFSCNLKGGAIGDLSISTYKAVGNLPWPLTVTHFNPATGPGNNAAAAVDRFWVLSKTGVTAIADIVFRFTPSERPAGMSTAIAANQGRAQPWRNGTVSNSWMRLVSPFTSQTYTQNYGQISGPSDSVRVINWDWPVIPLGQAPYFEPAGPIGNSNPWTITINASPNGDGPLAVPVITIDTVIQEICAGASNGYIGISVTGGVSPYAYLWNDGVPIEDRVNLTAGTYTVLVTDANGATATATVIVTVSNQPPATPSAISGSAYGVCNKTRSYSVNNIPGITFTWSVPGGATILSGQGTATVSIQFSNAYIAGDISVIASNPCGNSNARTKTVRGRPNKPSWISGPAVFCKTDTVTYTTTGVTGATSYIWTVPIGILIISGQSTASITVTGVSSSLTGDIFVKAKNDCGTSGYYCIPVEVQIAPQAISSITGSANGVCGQTLNYTVPSQPGVTYTWTIPSGANLNSGQGTNSISVTYSNSNITGSISVTASGFCGPAVSKSKTVRAKPVAPTTITGPGTICYNQQSVSYSCPAVAGATWYDWTIPAGASFVSGQGTTNVILNFNGTPGTTVQLKVKASNNCGSSSNYVANIILNNCPRVAGKEAAFNLHPNPATSHVLITWNNGREEDVRISCIDILGKTVIAEQILSGSGAQQLLLNTGALSSGVYIIRLQAGEETVQSKKLVIE